MNAQLLTGDIPVTERARPTAANGTCSRKTTTRHNTGSRATSKIHFGTVPKATKPSSPMSATTNGYGKTAQLLIGDMPATERARLTTAAGSTGTNFWAQNTGSLASSSIHGRGAMATAVTNPIGATTNGYGKTAQKNITEIPATERACISTAAGSTGTHIGPKKTGSLATSTIHGRGANEKTQAMRRTIGNVATVTLMSRLDSRLMVRCGLLNI